MFARNFLDETVVDWDTVLENLGEQVQLSEKVSIEKYKPTHNIYSGDVLFQKLVYLTTKGCFFECRPERQRRISSQIKAKRTVIFRAVVLYRLQLENF